MARHVGVGDEESQFGSTRVQPVSSPARIEERHNDGRKTIASTFRGRLGLEEVYTPEVWRASLAELLATATLTFGVNAIVISSYQTDTKTPNLVLSICTAILIVILLLAIYPISGGHINPAVTLSAVLVGLITISRAIIYILAQCVGGVFGALALKAVIGSSIERAYSLGGCTLSVMEPGPNGTIEVGIETIPALWLEVICTFVFLFASISIAFDKRQAKALGPVTVCTIIGIVIGILGFVSSTVTAKKGYSGVGLNPAKCLGPAIVRGGDLWNRHWVFWIGPAIASVAFYLYCMIIHRA